MSEPLQLAYAHLLVAHHVLASVYPMLACTQGLGQTVAFCGDGLNDLAALVTAEVGLAIGPLDAMVAAPVSTRRSSIAGSAALHIAEVASSRTPQFVVHMAVCLAVYALGHARHP